MSDFDSRLRGTLAPISDAETGPDRVRRQKVFCPSCGKVTGASAATAGVFMPCMDCSSRYDALALFQRPNREAPATVKCRYCEKPYPDSIPTLQAVLYVCTDCEPHHDTSGLLRVPGANQEI